MKDDKIRVINLPPGKTAEIIEVENSLEKLQELVGGFIEVKPLEDDVVIVCNKDGKLNGLPMNRTIRGRNGEVSDIICGSFFICYAPPESEEFLSMPEDLQHKHAARFEMPERFYRTMSGISSIKVDPKACYGDNEYEI